MKDESSPSTHRRYFDNTILKDYRDCPRKYYLRHKRGWRKEGISLPLVFGLSWHSAMDVVWRHYNRLGKAELIKFAMAAFENTWEGEGVKLDLSLEDVADMSPRIPAVAKEMLICYLDKKEHILKNCTVLAVEQPFAVPLPLYQAPDASIWYAGRLDKVVDYNGQRMVVEHKTTTEYKKDGGFKTQYVEGWYLDSQCMGYLYGGGLYFDGLEQVWVDAALVHKQVHDAFRFIPINHQFGMLEQWVEDTKEWVRRILRDEARFAEIGMLVGGVFPKQQESCVGKYGPCTFTDICRTTYDPSLLKEPPAGYIHEPWSPFDVLKLAQLEQGVTNEQKGGNGSDSGSKTEGTDGIERSRDSTVRS